VSTTPAATIEVKFVINSYSDIDLLIEGGLGIREEQDHSEISSLNKHFFS
jgi:hypothetical protein